MVRDDDEVNSTDFPKIRAIIKATATSQGQHVPIRWVNNVTAKLTVSGILSISMLRDAINRGNINTIVAQNGKPGFNKITISGIQSELELGQDFRQGRSQNGMIDCPVFLLILDGSSLFMDAFLRPTSLYPENCAPPSICSPCGTIVFMVL
jgi:hypothetical protein